MEKSPEAADADDGEMIIRSKRYKQALTGAKVHDASMQTSKLGGVTQQDAAKPKTRGSLGHVMFSK